MNSYFLTNFFKKCLYGSLFLAAVLICHKPLIGLILKAYVRFFAQTELAYRELRIEGTALVLRDVVFFDGASYLVRAETVTIDWIHTPSLRVHLDRPHVTLSQTQLQQNFRKGPTNLALHMENGILDWSDGTLPPAQFSYTSDFLEVRWEEGIVTARKTAEGWCILADHLPIQFLSQYVAAAGVAISGQWSASIDAGAWRAETHGLSLQFEGRRIEGALCASGTDGQIVVTTQFGGASGRVTGSRDEWQVDWEGLQPPEWAILQQFAPLLGLQNVLLEWTSGVLQGALAIDQKREILWQSLQGKDLRLRSERFLIECTDCSLYKGQWDLQNLWLKTPENLSICKGRMHGDLFTHRAHFEGALGDDAALINLQGTLYVDANSLDSVDLEGRLVLPLGNERAEIPFYSPRVHWLAGDPTHFDVRCQGVVADFLRIVGTMEEARFQIDSEKSHLFGEPLVVHECSWDGFSHAKARFDVLVPCELMRPLCNGIPFEEDLRLAFSLACEPNQWQVTCNGRMGPLSASCLFTPEGDAWRMSHGKASSRGIAFDFEGNISQDLHIDATLANLRADLSLLRDSCRGFLDGHGRLAFDGQKTELDFDLTAADLAWDSHAIENSQGLHVYACIDPSHRQMDVTGVDCRIALERGEAHVSADLIQVDLEQWQIAVQKGRATLPSEMHLIGDGTFAWDGSECHFVLQEALLSPLHLQNVTLSLEAGLWRGSGTLLHQGNRASFSTLVTCDSALRGTLRLQDETESASAPLCIDWAYAKQGGLLIDSIEGAFAGVLASFRKQPETSLLLGSARLDFQQLLTWIPSDVAEFFGSLKMGGGYELKGALDLARNTFQGLFCGKEIELFGYNFRTLMADVEICPTAVRLSKLQVSDPAGTLRIDKMDVQSCEGRPWTIEMPSVAIEELRPSLLRKPGREAGPLTPLLVRHLTMSDFRGLLSDGKTFNAKGNLSFLNSFKRGSTVLDLPSYLFGWIIGLDLELLIPVEGQISFALQDGHFRLTDLANAFSEGKRSEFFLVQADASPQMDLQGNLQILVSMKQFVLFALTEPFLISVNGTLSKPQFSLQKKRRFL